jgi:Spy/CpxP family protein refolding chaperone
MRICKTAGNQNNKHAILRYIPNKIYPIMKTKLSRIHPKIRFVVMIIAMISISATTLFAQGGGRKGPGGGPASPEDRAKRLTMMMKDELSLTAAQEPKIADINLKYAKKNEELKKISDTSAQRKEFQKTNKLRDGEVKAILTPEQFKKYLKLQEEMKARRRGMQH